MKSHAYVRRKLPLAGVLARFLLVSLLIFATFNPSYYSILTWIAGSSSPISIKAFVMFTLALSWMIILRFSLAGLGRLGLLYVAATGLALFLLEMRFGFLPSVSAYTLTILIELALAVIVTFGLVFSYWVRQASGQSAVVKRPP
jgi:hypothetical protein